MTIATHNSIFENSFWNIAKKVRFRPRKKKM
jgi:hypothetical protein